MADIHCARCGMPWPVAGLHHSDMADDQASIFLRGLGCLRCLQEPATQRPGHRERFIRDCVDVLTSDEAPVRLLDALAEVVEAGRVMVTPCLT